MMTAN